MNSSEIKEPRENIRKSLPLKIFEHRKEAKCILEYIELIKKDMLEIKKICSDLINPYFKIEGNDCFGNSITVETYLKPYTYELIKDAYIEGALRTLKIEKDRYAEIPKAKIITVDFREQKVDVERQQYPNASHRKEVINTVLKGTVEIAKAAGVNVVEVKTLVKEKGLPAFKIPGRRSWFAFPEEIKKWKKEQVCEYERQ